MNFDFRNPYQTTRIPIFARNVVSTSHPLAAQAGLRIQRRPSPFCGAARRCTALTLPVVRRRLDAGVLQPQICRPLVTRHAGASTAGLEINVEQQMALATVQGLAARGHRVEVINDGYQDFGAGQFIWRMSDPKVEGYLAVSDARRDGQAAGW